MNKPTAIQYRILSYTENTCVPSGHPFYDPDIGGSGLTYRKGG
jgi:hypothetical protein